MKIIPLTQGKVAVVDDDDYERLSGAGGQIKMHHQIIGKPPEGFVTDHRNTNGLDNRKDNLRHITQAKNVMNKKAQRNNTSGFKGVYWHKAGQKWCAEIKADGKRVRLGLFVDKDAAAQAYNAASERLHGEFGRASA